MQGEGDGFLEICEDESALFDAFHDGAEIVIKQEHVSGSLGHIRARTHGNSDIGLLNCCRIVDSITSDSNDVARLLAGADYQQLLSGSGTSKYHIFFVDPIEQISSFFWIGIVQLTVVEMLFCQQVSVYDDSSAFFPCLRLAHGELIDHIIEFGLGIFQDVYSCSNCCCSWSLIARDHDDLDTSSSALFDRELDSRSCWVVERGDTDQAKVVHGERARSTVSLGAIIGVREFRLLPSLQIKLEVQLWVLICWQPALSKRQYPFSTCAEASVGLLNLCSELGCEFNFFSIHEHASTSR